jgi:ribose transport system substrate-binding protein
MTRQRAFTPLARWAPRIALVAGTAVLAAACGSSGPSSTSLPPKVASGTGLARAKTIVAQQSQATRNFPPPGPRINVRSLRGKSVWYIPISLGAPVFAISNNTLRTALSKVGITEHSCSAQANPSTTSACINQAVSQGADAIVTDAIPVVLAANAFASAQSHHIPVLVVNQLPPPPGLPGAVHGFGDDKLAYQPLQAPNTITAEAEWVIADSGGKANVLMEPYTDSPSTLAYAAKAQAAFKRDCPGCTVAIQKIGLANASLVSSQTSSALLKNPNTQYVMPEFDALLQGVAQGVQQAGFAGKAKLVTSGGDLPALQQIKAGRLAVDAGEDFPYIGWAEADEAMRMMLGKPIVTEKPPLRIFTAQNVPLLNLTPADQASGSWYGSQAYIPMFEHLWGLK